MGGGASEGWVGPERFAVFQGFFSKLLPHLCCSGYDFGYLIKILSNANLPEEEVDFFEILRLYFPVIYDVKYLMKSCKSLKVSPSSFI